MPAYFTRGSGHNEKAQYSERPDDYVHNMERLSRKFETARQYVPKPVVEDVAGAEVGIIGFGTSHFAIDESRDQLDREAGVQTGYLRLRAYPFTDELPAFHRPLRRGSTWSSRTGTRRCWRSCATSSRAERIAKLRSVLHYSGLPIDARSVTDDILGQEGHKPLDYPHREIMAAGVAGRGE